MSLANWRDRVPGPLLNDRRVIFLEAILLFLVVWELTARVFDITILISSPVLVGVALYELLLSGDWVPHFVASMRRILYGFAVSVALGIAGGILFGVSDFWRQTFRFYVLIGMAMPGLLVVIFAAMWFGISDNTPMVATVILTTPFIVDIVQSGVDDIDPDLLNMSGSFGVSRRRVYRRLLIPSILPEVFSSVRFAFSVAWKIAVLAEVVISNVGIGFTIRDYMSRLDMTGVLKYLVLFVIVMLLIEYGVFRQIEKRMFDWREDVQASMAAGPG